MRQEVLGCLAWNHWVGVRSSRGRVVGASLTAVNAHQPPKRGERRDEILVQCCEGIEGDVNMGCEGRVGVGVKVDGGEKLGPGALKVISDKSRGANNLTMQLFCEQTNDVATSRCIFPIAKTR